MKIIETSEGPVRAYTTRVARERAIIQLRAWARRLGFQPLFIHGTHQGFFTIQFILR